MEKHNQKGITLISLVITIIVLLILSVAVITQTVGIDGIANKAGTSKESYQVKEDREIIEVSKQEIAKINSGDIPKKPIQDKLEDIRFDVVDKNLYEELKYIELQEDEFIVKCREHYEHYYKVTPYETIYLGNLKDIPIITIGDIDINSTEIIIPVTVKCENGLKSIKLPNDGKIDAKNFNTLPNAKIKKEKGNVVEVSFTHIVYATGSYTFRATSLSNTTSRKIVTIGTAGLKIKLDPTIWTNKTVTATVEGGSINTQIKAIDESTWNTSKEYITNRNCVIVAKEQTEDGMTKMTSTVTNIDKLKPNNVKLTVPEKTINSFKLKIVAKDQNATKDDGKSGIHEVKYYVTKLGEVVKQGTIIVDTDKHDLDKTVEISGLEVGTTYKYYVDVTDYAGNTYSTKDSTSSSTDEITTLYQYNITYNGNGSTGGSTASQIKTEGTAINLQNNGFTKTGYTFKEWNTKADGTGTVYAAGANYTNNSALTLYAQWTANTYTVTFNANGGTCGTANKQVTYDANYEDLPTATRTGYTFEGWFTQASGGTQVISTTKVTTASNHTVYAHWTANTYTITYNGNGATGGSTAQSTHTYDTAKALTANGFTRAYTVTYNHNYSGSTNTTKTATYTFKNWNIKADGTGTTYTNQQSVTNLLTTGNLNLYAQWNSANVSYAPTRTGYIFAGWYKEAACTNKVSDADYTPTANITVYAKWTANTYTVTYNGNGATGGSTAQSTHTYDVAKALTANGFTRAYTVTYNHNYSGSTNTTKTATYTFKNWNTKADGTGTTYTNQQSVKNLGTSGNVNLYAQWNSANVSYAPTRTGYTFGGWYKEAACTNKVSDADYTPTANITVYAKWTANTYTITYNGNGATGGSTAQSTHTYNTAKALTANGFTRAYTVTYNHNYSGSTNTTKTATYTFKNWNTKADGTGTTYTNQQSVKNLGTSGNVNLYAQWNTGNAVSYTPTRTGYTFGGWYKEAACTNKVSDANYTPTANITVYAKWTANKYTLTVKHYLENIDDTKYQFCETSTYANIAYGTTLTLANYKKAITNGTYSYGSLTDSTNGGTATATTTMGINTTICLYYKRNTYTLTVNKGNYIASVTGGGTYKVGKQVTVSAKLADPDEGYMNSWDKWTSSNTTLLSAPTTQNATITIPAGNITLTANGKTVRQCTLTLVNGSVTETRLVPSGYKFSEKANKKSVQKYFDWKDIGYYNVDYTFVGWRTDKNKVQDYSETYIITEDITLYATYTSYQWVTCYLICCYWSVNDFYFQDSVKNDCMEGSVTDIIIDGSDWCRFGDSYPKKIFYTDYLYCPRGSSMKIPESVKNAANPEDVEFICVSKRLTYWDC